MNRRAFLAALGIGAPLIAVPRRAYSFLWGNPLALGQRFTIGVSNIVVTFADGTRHEFPHGTARIWMPDEPSVARVELKHLPGSPAIECETRRYR